MTRKAKLIKQVMYAVASNMMQLMAFVMVILVGRYLGPEGLGLFSYAQSLAMIVVGFANFGLAMLTTRDVAKDHSLAPRYFALLVPWVALLAVFMCLTVVAIVYIAQPDDTTRVQVCALMAVAIACRVVGLIARALLQGLQRFGYEAGAIALENIVMLPVGVLLLMAGNGIVVFTLGILVSRLAGTIFMLGGLRQLIKLRFTFDPKATLGLQKQAFSIGLSKNIHFMSIHIDTLLLAWFLPVVVTAAAPTLAEARDIELGEFNAAFRVYVGMMLVPMMAVSLLLPKLSASMLGTKQNHNALLLAGIGAMGVIGLLAVGVGYFLTPFGIRLLYGDGFDDAVPVMRLLLFAMIPTFQYFFMNSYLVAIGRNRMYLAASIIGLTMRVGMCLTLMHVMDNGIVGAAIGVIIAESTALLAIWVYLLRVHFKPGSPREVVTKLREAVTALSLRE